MEKDSVKEIKQDGDVKQSPNLDFIMDIPLEVSVELGRTKIDRKSVV